VIKSIKLLLTITKKKKRNNKTRTLIVIITILVLVGEYIYKHTRMRDDVNYHVRFSRCIVVRVN